MNAAPPEGVSTSDVPYRPGPFRRLYDKITGRAAVRHPWYTLPEALGLAELIGIRDTLRRENLFDTSRLNHMFPSAHLSPGAFALVAMGAVFGAASPGDFFIRRFCVKLRDYNWALR